MAFQLSIRAAREDPIQTQRQVTGTRSYREGNAAAIFPEPVPSLSQQWRQRVRTVNLRPLVHITDPLNDLRPRCTGRPALGLSVIRGPQISLQKPADRV
jgi:hypothetical protein